MKKSLLHKAESSLENPKCRCTRFFTRYVKQAGALSTTFAVPWRSQERGHDIRRQTRAPFYEMWVKTGPWRTLQEALESL